jgi:hypothetical protein
MAYFGAGFTCHGSLFMARPRRSATVKASLNADAKAEIDALLDEVLGKGNYFGRPKHVCQLAGVSLSTFNRAVAAGLIATTPLGDGIAIARPVLRRLLLNGLGSMTGKTAS